MKFPYSGFISRAPDTGEEIVVFRPEVPIRIRGAAANAAYMALVDTGADNTILPRTIAEELDIKTLPAKGPDATAFGGQKIPLSYADVVLEIEFEGAQTCWQARVHFFDDLSTEPETVVVGHQGFLDYFIATFDGRELTLDLEPTDEIPLVGNST